MGTPFLHEFKRQASSFFKEKIKAARLALTDVTPAELLTEEATSGTPWAPDTRTMGLISRAAFEVDDYWRIVDILHKRLLKFDRTNWRGSYKALILLEHLLTHGPKSVAEEFQSDIDVIREMGSFQYVDEKGFNWGLSVRKKSERILELLEDVQLIEKERAKARKLTRGIEGFGSFIQRSSSLDGSLKELSFMTYGRCNSQCNNHQDKVDEFITSSKGRLSEKGKENTQQIQEEINSLLEKAAKSPISGVSIKDGLMHDECENQTILNRNMGSKEILPEELHEWNYNPVSKPLLGDQRGQKKIGYFNEGD
ncbi:hypothetical protein L1049_012307 [Liquidambar formosana]|uniref:ENTH domain-containing protein n=1 Tax=Liquidambar formosana TaxID=63359 RepID=A0AAP0WYP7_LIQFO